MTDVLNDKNFILAEVLVSPSHNSLELGDKRITLQPKAMAVLSYLALHSERVVSAQELMDNLWIGRIVTPGSVQKSINSLRTAFIDLMGDTEVITHYSKRGYQLKVSPQFIDNHPVTNSLENKEYSSFEKSLSIRKKIRSPLIFGVLFFIISTLAISYYWHFKDSYIPKVIKHHVTQFTTTQGYTLETGHERNPTPHPDNRHVAYIRDKMVDSSDGDMESDIVIRDATGKDWQLSKTSGAWYKLAWSPSGKVLAAVEVKSRDSGPRYPNFYEKANYLYTFHIFSLDLEHHRLLEKQILSQWQGRIFSLSWWDEETLEIIAKQGANGNNARYRYFTSTQDIKLMDELETTGNPIASSILKKRTALVSLKQSNVQVDFLNEQQKSIARYFVDGNIQDLSWIPDGSGVLLFLDDEQRLSLLYLNGEQVSVPINVEKDKVISRPKYKPDGSGIYFSEEQRSSNIKHYHLNEKGLNDKGLNNQISDITHNNNLNCCASFSHTGDKIVYSSVRNNQIHLWLVENNVERQITSTPLNKKVNVILWTEKDTNIIYSSGTDIYNYDFASAKNEILLQENARIEPVLLDAGKHLYFIKSLNETRNLWQLDLQSQQEKQLSFGAVGSALAMGEDILFQYVGESGLWVFHQADQKIEQVSSDFPVDSKLLEVDEKGIYFISGGVCNESDIYYSAFKTAEKMVVLKRKGKMFLTSSFNAKTGSLQTECYLPEANIVLIK